MCWSYLHFYSILRRALSLWGKYLHFRLKNFDHAFLFHLLEIFLREGSPKIVSFRTLPKIPLPRKQKEKSKSTSVAGLIREGFKKSKWKFKMAFAIRRPTPPSPPLNGTNFQTFFYPTFFLLQLNPTYMKRILYNKMCIIIYFLPISMP